MNRDQMLRASSDRKIRFGLILSLLGIVFAWQGAVPARADDSPRIVKTRLFVKLWQNHSYWPPKATQEQYDTTSWLPDIRFRIIGPLPGGSQLSVDVTRPDGSPWVSFDLPTQEIAANQSIDVETPRDPPGGTKVFTTATGVHGFTIRLKNALTGQNQALFSNSGVEEGHQECPSVCSPA